MTASVATSRQILHSKAAPRWSLSSSSLFSSSGDVFSFDLSLLGVAPVLEAPVLEAAASAESAGGAEGVNAGSTVLLLLLTGSSSGLLMSGSWSGSNAVAMLDCV